VKNAGTNLAIIRRFVLNLFRLNKTPKQGGSLQSPYLGSLFRSVSRSALGDQWDLMRLPWDESVLRSALILCRVELLKFLYRF
jgi:hypothetical protein